MQLQLSHGGRCRAPMSAHSGGTASVRGSGGCAMAAATFRPSQSASRAMSVVCMAHPRRVAKVSSQIQREISELFIYDKVVQEAICPERRRGLDDKLSAVASVTNVYVSNDLQVVKVYVSVYSDERGKDAAIANLKRIAPYVRSRIGQSVKLRLTPEIRFLHDDSLDELEKIETAIGRDDFQRYVSEAETGGAALPQPAEQLYTSGQADDDDDDDGGGFFDIDDAGEGEDAELAAAEAGVAPPPRRVSWSRHDPETFFAVDDDEDEDEDEEEVLTAADVWYNQGGPFDDLFSGGGDTLAQEPKRGRRSRGGGGGGAAAGSSSSWQRRVVAQPPTPPPEQQQQQQQET